MSVFISDPADTAFYGPELNISAYKNKIEFLGCTTGLKLKVQSLNMIWFKSQGVSAKTL